MELMLINSWMREEYSKIDRELQDYKLFHCFCFSLLISDLLILKFFSFYFHHKITLLK